ncbi:FAD/NAD(P)-binding domain-containing protein [Plectosphaerella plurivora]|uniref:FAD/NAD(P)-binding domain-containing protein n=1 Tax=Plectosphaerella plurivora TaxID=936078 RepID=A0A9P8VLQ5_9PEZI|nr:FAD/NAD(P)-binding domain-containing protein [Plectosphaerella plurivora]
MSSTKNIVILGGSYGGISTAHYTLRHIIPALPQSNEYQVVLISTSPEVFCRPASPRALISDELFDQAKLFVDVEASFSRYPGNVFKFIKGTVTAVDDAARTVSITNATGTAQTFDYHALVVATGASTPSPLFSLNRDADFLRSSWAALRASLPNARSIIIAGGGPAGIETAGELGEHLNGKPGWFGSGADPKVKITVVTSVKDILPHLRPALAHKAEGQLAKLGVTVVKNTRVESVSPEATGNVQHVGLPAEVTLSDGRVLQADIYINATGMTPNSKFMADKLRRADGRIETNAATLRVDGAGPRVYAIGDVASSARPAVHNILSAVPVLCANMKRDLLLDAGKTESEVKPEREFKEDTRETQLVPIGRGGGVGAFMGYQVPSIMVWMIKGRDYWLGMTGGLWSGKQWEKET